MLTPLFLNTKEGKRRFDELLNRKFSVSREYEEPVIEILERIRKDGDRAIVDLTRRFDCPDFDASNIKVTAREMEEAHLNVDEEFIRSIDKAIDHIKEFHRRQIPKSWIMTREDGSIMGQVVKPVDAAGLYVPGGRGGKTPLVSSVLMNGIPAVLAGVKRIILSTPPCSDKSVSPYLLVAAGRIGIKEIYKAGSAWAIGAMAYGTETIEPVDVIVGPGNIFVTAAKRIVSGTTVGIDMVAGPSEVLVIADTGAPAEYVAADLLSQAEHDPMATVVLLSTSTELAKAVSKALERLLSSLERRETAKKALEDNGASFIVEDLISATELANKIAPEHLELLVEDPWALLPMIRHAGAIFMGRYSPEPVGDYIAGPNHVLPTMGTARFASALGVETFLKRSSLISYSEKALQRDADDIIRLAETEGLTAHSLSIRVRKDK